MQNRLDAAREAQAASERQLAEVRAAIAAERAARPESVRLFFFLVILHVPCFLRRDIRINARLHWHASLPR